MSKRYETVFILTPVLSEDQTKEAVTKFKKELQDSGAKIHHEEHWGLRKLAYPIQKKTTGFYHLMEFEVTEGGTIDKLETSFRRDERIMRFLTMKMEGHAVTYAESRRGKKKKSAKAE